jgi:hypothetical protein
MRLVQSSDSNYRYDDLILIDLDNFFVFFLIDFFNNLF